MKRPTEPLGRDPSQPKKAAGPGRARPHGRAGPRPSRLSAVYPGLPRGSSKGWPAHPDSAASGHGDHALAGVGSAVPSTSTSTAVGTSANAKPTGDHLGELGATPVGWPGGLISASAIGCPKIGCQSPKSRRRLLATQRHRRNCWLLLQTIQVSRGPHLKATAPQPRSASHLPPCSATYLSDSPARIANPG